MLDGDTVVLSDFSRVRLLGIDTPESDQFYYSNSRAALERLVLQKEVTLEADTDPIDQYGRLLRYVYADGVFVNREMVSRGHAHVRIYSSNTRYAATLRAAQQTAKAAATNYWTPSSITCIAVSSFQYADTTDERFTLQNNCPNAVDLSNWVGYDEGNEQYRFPIFTLTNGSMVTVHTFSGTNTGVDLYWGRPSNRYIWNNDYDTLFLRDTSGLLVLTYSYGQ
ncbi:thermonuclease family protein [Candidatus Micrarchaeota archaeon]|nr:thermonuclease family protein [Candidatus Micrarchaeota archaeon]